MAFFIPALIAGASALAGALGNRGQKVTSNSTQNQQTDNSYTNVNTTAPEYSAEQDLVKNFLFSNYLGRAMEMPNFMDQYAGAGLSEINKGAEAKKRMVENFLRSRGLGRTSTGVAGLADVEGGRIGQSVDFMNTLPTVQENFERTRLGDLASFLSSTPVATRSVNAGSQTTKTSGTGSQETNYPGNPWGGAVSNLAGSLAYFAGKGWFGGPKANE